jgi:hemoglobin-like flavoprotein
MYNIEQNKVKGVVAECNKAIIALRANHGEVLVGLAELLGRVIVDQASNHIHANEMYMVVQEQLLKTIETGSEAKAKSLIHRA